MKRFSLRKIHIKSSQSKSILSDPIMRSVRIPLRRLKLSGLEHDERTAPDHGDSRTGQFFFEFRGFGARIQDDPARPQGDAVFREGQAASGSHIHGQGVNRTFDIPQKADDRKVFDFRINRVDGDDGITMRFEQTDGLVGCLLYTSPSPRDRTRSRMPSSA